MEYNYHTYSIDWSQDQLIIPLDFYYKSLALSVFLLIACAIKEA